MNASIVVDARDRLGRALGKKRKLRRAEILREVETRHGSELHAAGFWRRLLIRRRIIKEVAAILARELPSDQALFIR